MESKFTGGVLGLIGINLLTALIVLITLTIGTPWAVCKRNRWYAKHTFIDDKQVVFDGKGIQLFGNIVKWILLTVITIGIFAFWIPVKQEKWKVSHTHYVSRAALA